MNKFYLTCLACFGLSLMAWGQNAKTTPKALQGGINAAVDGRPAPGESAPLEITLPVSRGDMTITESYQSDVQTKEDIGANYNFEAIDEGLSEALESDEAMWKREQTNEDGEAAHTELALPVVLIAAGVTAMILLGLVWRIQSSKRV